MKRGEEEEYEERRPSRASDGVAPLEMPDVVRQFARRYIPCDSEQEATDVMTIGNMRDEFCCWVPFGAKEDPLQGVLDCLGGLGFHLSHTSSGPALFLIDKQSDRSVDVQGLFDGE